MTQPNDHAGLVYMLDAAGRTIQGLEQRVAALEVHVAEVTRERDALRHLLAEVRATADVPPPTGRAAENGHHEPTAPDPSGPA